MTVAATANRYDNSAAASAASTDWQWSSSLPWPAARGARLWAQLASDHGLTQYAVELCEPSAGHIALVLVKKPAAAAPGTPRPVATNANATDAPPAKGRRGSSPQALAATHAPSTSPRVVYVVDAIPPRPKTKTTANAVKLQPTRSSSNSNSNSNSERPSPTRVLSPASSTSTRSSSSGPLGSSDSTGSQLLQDADELDLIDELFASGSKAGKDGCVLAKAPMLCARFDCKVVAIQFTRGQRQSFPTQTQTQTLIQALPLRCLVAREDGMAYVWEWGADLHAWTFLNRFCFLANANLKWTKPVAAFTATPMAWHSETTELAWWSRESRDAPTLCLRKLEAVHASTTFRTELTLGHAFALTTTDVLELRSSKLGLWVVTRLLGVHFRSAESLRMVSLNWQAVLGHGDDDGTNSPIDPAVDLLLCLHNVTGELLVLERATGAVFLVTPKQMPTQTPTQTSGLRSEQLATLATWSQQHCGLATRALSVAAHRHVLLVVTSDALHAFSYLTGDALATIALPGAAATATTTRFHPAPAATTGPAAPQLWTITGAASAVGLWTPAGFWFLRTPSARSLSTRLARRTDSRTGDPRAAFESLAVYGPSLALETAEQALAILELAVKSLDVRDDRVWRAAWTTIASPALLLALFADQNVPTPVVDALANVVATLHAIANDVTVRREFPTVLTAINSSSDGNGDRAETLAAAQRLTPANVEALHHLSNWVLLAKRKSARLQTSAHFRSRHRLRPRAVSALTLATTSDAAASPLRSSAIATGLPLTVSALELLTAANGGDDDPDATNFRLSRKLRPMSSLRFASGSCAAHHGRQWLAQLESFLLDGVAFKTEGGMSSNNSASPSHLLFHDERRLEDYRSAVASFSRHMYVESMSRLYLLHEPAALLPFVQCVAAHCPRAFSLAGATRVSRSHAERALALLPPLEVFTTRLVHEQLQSSSAFRSIHTKTKSKTAMSTHHSELARAHDSLVAYTDLLVCCGYYREACGALLHCGLFERCRDELLARLVRMCGAGYSTKDDKDASDQDDQDDNDDDDKGDKGGDMRAACSAVYFALLEHCVANRSVCELEQLLMLKPAAVSALHVLRALQTHLTRASASNTRTTVTVGQLRAVLLTLLQQQRSVRATA